MLAGKCEGSKCASLNTDLASIKTDLDVVKACFNDPSDAVNCQGNNYIQFITWFQGSFECFISATYGTANNLPMVLAGKCEDSTCTTLTTDLDVVKNCFNDPTDATSCRGMLMKFDI